ncbi:MAG: hypothetical protein AABY22_31080 [Nanoarchaeota archaeon]
MKIDYKYNYKPDNMALFIIFAVGVLLIIFGYNLIKAYDDLGLKLVWLVICISGSIFIFWEFIKEMKIRKTGEVRSSFIELYEKEENIIEVRFDDKVIYSKDD